MKAIALALLVVAGTAALAQKPPTLEEPKPVDVRVESFQWHPDGTALMYARKEDEKGQGIGLYRLGDEEGKVLVHLKEGDTYECQWLEGMQVLILIVYRSADKVNEVDIHVLNAKTKTDELVYTRQSNEKLDVDVDPSPSLLHAIFRIKEGGKRAHFVLPLQGGRLRPSPDIDQAVDSGCNGPLWSVDGTAIYQNGGGLKLGEDGTFILSQGDKAKLVGQTLEFTIDKGDLKLAGDGGLSLSFRFTPPAPPVGTPVLEVVPANGVLRQIRFKAAWEERATPPTLNQTKAEPRRLEFGGATGQANSLWIVTGKENEKGISTFVAAHSQKAILAPSDKGIGYLTDTALFVRRFASQRRGGGTPDLP
jgi:hypothetical protein